MTTAEVDRIMDIFYRTPVGVDRMWGETKCPWNPFPADSMWGEELDYRYRRERRAREFARRYQRAKDKARRSARVPV